MASYILHLSVTLTLAILGTSFLSWGILKITDLLVSETEILIVSPDTEQASTTAISQRLSSSICSIHRTTARGSNKAEQLPSTCFSSAMKQKKSTLTISKGTTTNSEGNDCTKFNPMPRRTSQSNPPSLSVLGLSLF